MNGDRELLALRRRGREPVAVWVTDSDDLYSRTTAKDWHINADAYTGAFYAHIRVEAGDLPEALDFRCVNGLVCHVASDRGSRRFKRLAEALMAAGALAVAGVDEGHVHIERQAA